jgi:hypothetical protein
LLAYQITYREKLDFAEPVNTLDAIRFAAAALVGKLSRQLHADGKGARGFTLTLYDTQGEGTDVKL